MFEKCTLAGLAVLPLLPLFAPALGYTLEDGTGRLPALGWNSWVSDTFSLKHQLLESIDQTESTIVVLVKVEDVTGNP